MGIFCTRTSLNVSSAGDGCTGNGNLYTFCPAQCGPDVNRAVVPSFLRTKTISNKY